MTNIELEALTAVKSAARKYTQNAPNWEERKYEIASQLFIQGEDAESAIKRSEEFISKIKVK